MLSCVLDDNRNLSVCRSVRVYIGKRRKKVYVQNYTKEKVLTPKDIFKQWAHYIMKGHNVHLFIADEYSEEEYGYDTKERCWKLLSVISDWC